MAELTISNIDPRTIHLREQRAVMPGRTLNEEVLGMLREAVQHMSLSGDG